MIKENIKNELEKKITNSTIYLDEKMSKHTSFKIGGNADIYIKVKSQEDMINIIKYAKEKAIPVTVLGNGSNVLVKDTGIRGITLQNCIENTQIEKSNGDNVFVKVASGVKLAELAIRLQKEEISGFEFASGIPGTIGGAVKMNAGAYGKEIKDIVKTITYLDENFEIKTINSSDAEFTYRHSRFSKTKDIILSVELALNIGVKEEISQMMNEYKKSRIEKQPIDKPSAGSTFKRGEDFITAKLIDEAGLKNYQIGGAKVSEKHAGFIVNTGDATAEDVLALVDYVKKVILEKYGKEIELEIEVIG